MSDEIFETPKSSGPAEGQLAPTVKEVYCRVHGKVQGVMFRDFIAKQADRMRLKGYVKNLPDGTVEVVAQGGEHELNSFIGHMRHGSTTARVTEVEEEWRKPNVAYNSFDIAQ